MNNRVLFRTGFMAAALAACGAALAAMDGHQHGAGDQCDDARFACAVEATPTFAKDGSLWLTWSSPSRIHVARSTDLGRSFSAPVEITRGPEKIDHSADARPQIVVDGAGRVTVGYQVMTDVRFQGEIYHATSTNGGRSFSAPRQINVDPAGKRFLSLNLDPGGHIFATWVDKRGLAAAQAAGRPYSGAAVYGAWSYDGGATFGEPLSIGEQTCECCRLSVDFAGAGKPVVVWRNLFGDARDHAITTFRSAGVVGPINRVSDDDWKIDACPHHGPSVAVAPNGDYHVAWFTASDKRKGLFYAHSTDAGVTFSEPQPFGTAGRQPSRPRLLSVKNDLWLAWREYDGTATDVMVMHSGDSGRTWSAPRSFARSTGTVDHPLLVSNGRDVFVSWLTRAEGYRLLPLKVADIAPR